MKHCPKDYYCGEDIAEDDTEQHWCAGSVRAIYFH